MQLLWMTCLSVALFGCASSGPYRIHLMPAPDVYNEGVIDPFGYGSVDPERTDSLLYATDREPALENAPPFYLNERGHVLRLGEAEAEVAKEGIGWEELQRVSLLKERTKDFPLQVSRVHEIGILDLV